MTSLRTLTITTVVQVFNRINVHVVFSTSWGYVIGYTGTSPILWIKKSTLLWDMSTQKRTQCHSCGNPSCARGDRLIISGSDCRCSHKTFHQSPKTCEGEVESSWFRQIETMSTHGTCPTNSRSHTEVSTCPVRWIGALRVHAYLLHRFLFMGFTKLSPVCSQAQVCGCRENDQGVSPIPGPTHRSDSPTVKVHLTSETFYCREACTCYLLLGARSRTAGRCDRATLSTSCPVCGVDITVNSYCNPRSSVIYPRRVGYYLQRRGSRILYSFRSSSTIH